MKHVSRIRKVSFGLMIDRISLGPRISVHYGFRTQTRRILDQREISHVIQDPSSFNISFQSRRSCIQTLSIKLEKGNHEENIAATSRPVICLVSRSRPGISTVQFSTASSSPVDFGTEGHDLDLKASTVVIYRKWQMQDRWPARRNAQEQVRESPSLRICHWRQFGDKTLKGYNVVCRINFTQKKSERECCQNRPPGNKLDDNDLHSFLWHGWLLWLLRSKDDGPTTMLFVICIGRRGAWFVPYWVGAEARTGRAWTGSTNFVGLFGSSISFPMGEKRVSERTKKEAISRNPPFPKLNDGWEPNSQWFKCF